MKKIKYFHTGLLILALVLLAFSVGFVVFVSPQLSLGQFDSPDEIKMSLEKINNLNHLRELILLKEEEARLTNEGIINLVQGSEALLFGLVGLTFVLAFCVGKIQFLENKLRIETTAKSGPTGKSLPD